jgi:hypothetical protein
MDGVPLRRRPYSALMALQKQSECEAGMDTTNFLWSCSETVCSENFKILTGLLKYFKLMMYIIWNINRLITIDRHNLVCLKFTKFSSVLRLMSKPRTESCPELVVPVQPSKDPAVHASMLITVVWKH